MNRVMVHGRLVRDPEVRSAGAHTVCGFVVAENQRFNREKANFHECEAWNKTGDFVEKYFRKGQEIVISGELRQDEYTAKDGTNRRAWKINVDCVDFCGKAGDNSGGQAPSQGSAPKFEELNLGDDLPF